VARAPVPAAAEDASAPQPVERPLAASPLEAQTMIQNQLDTHMKSLWKCVSDYRAKKGDQHAAVVVDIGIDQEGHLLGVASANPKKGELDPELKACLAQVLRELPFPRSHTGVITVRQTFKDAPLYQ
jgi:hypothetical protein